MYGKRKKDDDHIYLDSSYFSTLRTLLIIITVSLVAILVVLVGLGIFIFIEKPQMEKVIVEIDRMSRMTDDLSWAIHHQRNHSESVIHKAFSILDAIHYSIQLLKKQHMFNNSSGQAVAFFDQFIAEFVASNITELYSSMEYVIQLQKRVRAHLDVDSLIHWIDVLQTFDADQSIDQLLELTDALQYVGSAVKKIDMEALLNGSKHMTDTIEYFRTALQHADLPHMIDRAAHVADVVDGIGSSMNTTEIKQVLYQTKQLLLDAHRLSKSVNVTAIAYDTGSLLQQLDSFNQQLKLIHNLKVITSVVSD